MSNILSPGEIIDRKRLATEYNVSIAPVKDALLMLAQDGLIDIRSRSVTIVRAIQKEDLHGTAIMREAIESQAARLICGDTIKENYSELINEASKLDAIEDQRDYWRADVEFHRHLVSLTKCQIMINTYRQVMNLGNFCKVNSFYMNDDPSGRLSHIKLIESLLTNDVSKADAVIRTHIRSGKT